MIMNNNDILNNGLFRAERVALRFKIDYVCINQNLVVYPTQSIKLSENDPNIILLTYYYYLDSQNQNFNNYK